MSNFGLTKAYHMIKECYTSEGISLSRNFVLAEAIADTYLFRNGLAAYIIKHGDSRLIPEDLIALDAESYRDVVGTITKVILGMNPRTLKYDYFTPLRFVYNVIQGVTLLPLRTLDYAVHKLSYKVKQKIERLTNRLEREPQDISDIISLNARITGLYLIEGITTGLNVITKAAFLIARATINPRRSYLEASCIHPVLGAVSLMTTCATQGLIAAPLLFTSALTVTATAGLPMIGPAITSFTTLSTTAVATIGGIFISLVTGIQSLRYINRIARKLAEEVEPSPPSSFSETASDTVRGSRVGILKSLDSKPKKVSFSEETKSSPEPTPYVQTTPISNPHDLVEELERPNPFRVFG